MVNIVANLTKKVSLFGSGQAILILHLFAMQFITTNASPAKSGSSSKSVQYHDIDPGAGFVNNRIENVAVVEAVSVSVPDSPSKITVYPWNNHLGRPADIKWATGENDCKEIPSRWKGKVRSVHTHNKCFVLFSQHNCGGPSKTVKVGSPSHNRLSDICFQRKPLSVRPCTQDEIEAPITDHV